MTPERLRAHLAFQLGRGVVVIDMRFQILFVVRHVAADAVKPAGFSSSSRIIESVGGTILFWFNFNLRTSLKYNWNWNVAERSTRICQLIS